MAYGYKPTGKAKPSNYPYGTAYQTEMVTAKGKGVKMPNPSKEWNKGPAKSTGGRIKSSIKGGR